MSTTLTRSSPATSSMEAAATRLAPLLGGSEGRAAVAGLGVAVPADTSIDVNLLRDGWEWEAVERCLLDADPGALVLVDGDLQPDWRIPSTFLAELLTEASAKRVL